MVRSASVLVLAAAWVALPAAAEAWGEAGHRIVGAIAEARLGASARATVRELAGELPLSSPRIAAWADAQRDPATRAWHYVDIPFWSGRYLRARDCPRDACAVAEVVRAEAVLSEADPRGGAVASADALRWLVHLVADLHQPLHAGDARDRGGNDLRVRLRNRREPTNLHRIWDVEVVAPLVAGRRPEQVAREILARVPASDVAAWAAQTDPAAWAEESNREARAIYAELGREPGDGALVPLTPFEYERAERARVETALARAGIRLAAALDRIAARRGRP